jgi:hypothetical protein
MQFHPILSFALQSFMKIEPRLNLAQISWSQFILIFELEQNWIIHYLQSTTPSSSTFLKISKAKFAYQEKTRGYHLGCFAESHDNIVETLSSKDTLTYNETKNHILNLSPTYHSFSEVLSKNPNPQYEANPISLSDAKYNKKLKKWASWSSNLDGNESNWCHMH